MTENLRAAVPSEPTTPALDLESIVRDNLETAELYPGGLSWQVWSLAERALRAEQEIERLRGEVGPSPEQIEAAARGIFEADPCYVGTWAEQDQDVKDYYLRIAKAALVAACSVRGPGE